MYISRNFLSNHLFFENQSKINIKKLEASLRVEFACKAETNAKVDWATWETLPPFRPNHSRAS
jgi:hypothetical protein